MLGSARGLDAGGATAAAWMLVELLQPPMAVAIAATSSHFIPAVVVPWQRGCAGVPLQPGITWHKARARSKSDHPHSSL